MTPLVTDDGFRAFEQLLSLERCDMGLNNETTPITDEGFSHFSNLQQLEWLSLKKTVVTDNGLSSLKKLAEVATLKHSQPDDKRWRSQVSPFA